MARKDLLKKLMESDDGAEPATASSRVDPAKPRYTSGAIGAVSRSIQDLKNRSLVDVDVDLIDDAGLTDRLDEMDQEMTTLIASIRQYGQQVPVLLRVHPDDPERFQIVYGRRRVKALSVLGQPVRAMIRNLDDAALILAQGQENSARKDLSFIEKANFARQMRDEGYDRKIIGDALAMDKTLISRLLSVADQVPFDLIQAIGSAPSVGRERWLKLADLVRGQDLRQEAVGATSDARFDAVMSALLPLKLPAKAAREVRDDHSEVIAKVTQSTTRTTINLPRGVDHGFDDWLIDHLSEIHRSWKVQRGE